MSFALLMDFVANLIVLYCLLSLPFSLLYGIIHWKMIRSEAKAHTDHWNDRIGMECQYGFITPREYDHKKESYAEGLRGTIIAHLLRSPIDLPANLYLLLIEAYVFLFHGTGPEEMISEEEIIKSIRDKNHRKLQEYKAKLAHWREEELRKNRETKYIWSAPSPVPR